MANNLRYINSFDPSNEDHVKWLYSWSRGTTNLESCPIEGSWNYYEAGGHHFQATAQTMMLHMYLEKSLQVRLRLRLRNSTDARADCVSTVGCCVETGGAQNGR